jgi:hypothetical protein
MANIPRYVAEKGSLCPQPPQKRKIIDRAMGDSFGLL